MGIILILKRKNSEIFYINNDNILFSYLDEFNLSGIKSFTIKSNGHTVFTANETNNNRLYGSTNIVGIS